MPRGRVTKVNSSILSKRPSASSVTQRTFEVLLEQIMTFRLKPFELVAEKGVSEMLGISRTPVREALARLASLGLIDIYAQRGSIVAPLRIEDLQKSQFLREVIEVGLVVRAIESLNRQALIQKLRDELAMQETLASIADDQRFFKSDELFHRHIATMAGFPGLWAEISTAKLHMDRFRFLSFPRMDNMSVVIDQHRAIVAAIESGKAQAAEAAMRTHLRRIFSVIDRVKERYPEYFPHEAEGQPTLADRITADSGPCLSESDEQGRDRAIDGP